MKLCKDCKYFAVAAGEFGSDRCTAQPRISFTDGKAYYDRWRNNPTCQREDGWFDSFLMNTCGKRAKWWEPK